MLSSEKEVPRRVTSVRIQMVTHRRVMVIPIRGLWREVVVMVHYGACLSGNIAYRGPASCDRRRHGSS